MQDICKSPFPFFPVSRPLFDDERSKALPNVQERVLARFLFFAFVFFVRGSLVSPSHAHASFLFPLDFGVLFLPRCAANALPSACGLSANRSRTISLCRRGSSGSQSRSSVMTGLLSLASSLAPNLRQYIVQMTTTLVLPCSLCPGRSSKHSLPELVGPASLEQLGIC